MIRLALITGVLFALYWFVARDGCGTRGAIACPDPALDEGVGVTLNTAEVCPGSGYLCVEKGGAFQVARWPLAKGKIRVRVPLPDFVDRDTAHQIRDAAVEAIREWDGHPFPIVIDTGKFSLRFSHIVVTWAQGQESGAGGHVRFRHDADGKRLVYRIDNMMVTIPPIVPAGAPDPAVVLSQVTPDSDPAAVMAQLNALRSGLTLDAALVRVRATAMHEMGHVLGLMHSDSENDIMFPQMPYGMKQARLSPRDLRTVDALYALPNGATVQ